MSEDSTLPPWPPAGKADPEVPEGSEPAGAESFLPPSPVPPSAVPLPAPEPARDDGEAGQQPPPCPAVDRVVLPVPAAPVPAASGPDTPPPPRRRRRAWIVALAGAVVAGLVVGLLVWAPWHQSPVAPTAVSATSRTATSVLVSWSASKGGAAPDHYLVLRDGKQVGSVPASRTSFTDTGLAPGSRHRYAVIAVAARQRSAASAKATVTTITPSPVGLTVSKATWTSVTLHWSPSPLGPVPGEYQIVSKGILVGVVPGAVDSYDITRLAAGASYTFEVRAVWENAVSAPSAPLKALTLAPPLTGDVAVEVNTVSTPGNGASLSAGEHWSDTWRFTADCAATKCTLTANADLAAPGFAAKPFKMTLRGSGTRYSGSAKAQISQCGSVSVTNTIMLTITAKGTVTNGSWAAWTGTMQISSPYTTAGTEYCPTQSWDFTMTGTNKPPPPPGSSHSPSMTSEFDPSTPPCRSAWSLMARAGSGSRPGCSLPVTGSGGSGSLRVA